MRIALDAMGGDKAPLEIIRGGVEAAREFDVEVAMVGHKAVIEQVLAHRRTKGLKISVIDAPSVVEMAEHPSSAIRQRSEERRVGKECRL